MHRVMLPVGDSRALALRRPPASAICAWARSPGYVVVLAHVWFLVEYVAPGSRPDHWDSLNNSLLSLVPNNQGGLDGTHRNKFHPSWVQGVKAYGGCRVTPHQSKDLDLISLPHIFAELPSI